MKIMNRKILEIAFYVAGRGTNGLGYSYEELYFAIQVKTVLKSFKQHIEDFRVLLSKEEEKRTEVPQMIIEVHNELKNKTATNLRKVVINNLKELKDGKL